MTATYSIEMLPITELNAYERNAKMHPQKQVQQIADSMREFGFINPIIVDENKVIIAGHGRFEAAKLLGLREVPTIAAVHLSKAQVRAYRLADMASAIATDMESLSETKRSSIGLPLGPRSALSDALLVLAVIFRAKAE